MTVSTMSDNKYKKALYKVLAVAFWIFVWEALARYFHSELILASPLKTLEALARIISGKDFFPTVVYSGLRILIGFFAAMIFGILLAALSHKLPIIKTLLSPITSVIKATPVASFIILALIWFGNRNLAVFISFLMVFPVIYLNILKGIESTDKQLLEMAKVYRMPKSSILLYIYLPQVMPFFVSACSVALGLCWKSGIAAEVIGITDGSIGEMLYRAKLYFETGDLLAWTAIIITVSVLFEKLFMALVKLLQKSLERRYTK